MLVFAIYQTRIMKLFYILILLFGSYSLVGQDWAGKYSGYIDQTPAIMELAQNGNQISGSIVAANYPYNLKATVGANGVTGTLEDPQTGGVMPLTLTKSGDQVGVTITTTDPNTYQEQQVTFTFSKGQGTESVKPNVDQPSSGEIDPNLVGLWRYTESYVSGDFSAVTEWKMQLNADGTYLYGDGNLAGGGNAGSFNSGGGDVSRGRWKVQQGIIYIDEGYGWSAYSGYYLEGNRLMLKFENGKNQVWHRIQ